MTQDELWLAKWQEVIDFMETYHRNPSKHRIEEHLMLNWIKHNRKLMNAGEMKEERVKLFRELLNIGERYRRKNRGGEGWCGSEVQGAFDVQGRDEALSASEVG